MNGKITFESAEALAEFLKSFTGATATFEVFEERNGRFTLEFNGGY